MHSGHLVLFMTSRMPIFMKSWFYSRKIGLFVMMPNDSWLLENSFIEQSRLDLLGNLHSTASLRISMEARDLNPGNCVWAPSYSLHLLQSLKAIVKTGKEATVWVDARPLPAKKTQGPPRVSALSNKAEMLTKNGKKHGQQKSSHKRGTKMHVEWFNF